MGCAWQLPQQLTLKCAFHAAGQRWEVPIDGVPRQPIFFQRAWSLPGATYDRGTAFSLCRMHTIPREINSLPLADQHGERTLGSVAPDSSFCGLSAAPTCVSLLHVDAEHFLRGPSLQPCWLMLLLFDLVLIALHHSASSNRLLSCFQIGLLFPFF